MSTYRTRKISLLVTMVVVVAAMACGGSQPGVPSQEQSLQATISALETQLATHEQPPQSTQQTRQSPPPAAQPTAILPSTPPSCTPLEVGQTWRESGEELSLKNVVLHANKIVASFNLRNQTGQQLIFQVSGDNFLAKDNLGAMASVYLPNVGLTSSTGPYVVGGGGTVTLETGYELSADVEFTLNLGNSQVTEVVITVIDLSRIGEACWRVPIYH